MEVKYANEQFPVLSYLYAILAGGEHELNCTQPDAYMNAYLPGASGKRVQSLIRQIPSNSHEPLRPDPAQLEQLLGLLKQELQQPNIPQPMW